MARTFVIPVIPPANAQKIGTSEDPWRPKYLRERGLGFTNSTTFRYWMLCEVIGTPAQLDALAAEPDVHEITASAIPAGKRTAINNWLAKRGVTANLNLTGDALVDELRRVCLLVQQAETPAIRAALFTDMTGL